jgi:ubiquinone/menaquinone biosynthesis C-methylase UbiE
VLEIGCGIGTDTINFARAGATVTAVDLSTESINLAKKRAEVFGVSDQITFYQGNAELLSEFVPVGEYDLVYSFGVIHHSPNPEKIVDQIVKHYIKPGTVFKLMVYNRASWKVLWMLMLEGGKLWKTDEIIAKHSEAQTGCPVTYSYTKTSVKNLIGDRFKVVKSDYEHIFPYQIPKYVKYEYEKEWYWKMMPDSVFKKFENMFGWHLCVTSEAK